MNRWIALVVVALSACGGDDDGGAVDSMPGVDGAASTDGSVAACRRTLAFGAVTFEPVCYVEEHVSGEQPVLDLPCDDGAVSATIGGVVFTGQVTGGAVELAYTSEFTWTDGCVWEYTETIAGALDASAWTYRYRDSLKVDCGGEQFECPADASVTASE